MEIKQKRNRKVGDLRLILKFAFIPIKDPRSGRKWVFENVWVVQRYVERVYENTFFGKSWVNVEVKSKRAEFEWFRFREDFIDGPQPIPK